MSTEDDVRALLHAAAPDAPTAPSATAERVIGRYLARRRAQRLAAAGVAAAVLVLSGGLAVLDSPSADPPTGTPQLVADPDVDVLIGAPRGNLADDQQLLAGLLSADWAALATDGAWPYDPAPQDRSVVFAGDVGDLRTALVAATVDGQRIGAWFTGQRGAPADQLRLAQAPTPLPTDIPQVRLDISTSPGALVVISAPGDKVLLSDAVTVTADGTLERSYRELETIDGVATATVGTTTGYGVAASVRIDRNGATVFRGAPLASALPGPAAPLAPVRAPAAQPGPPAVLVERFAADLARATGLDPATLQIRSLWSGAVPGPDGAEVPAAVLAATYPSSAVAIAGGWTSTGGTGPATTWCSFAFSPAGTEPAAQPLAMRCTVAGTTVRASLVLVPPARTAAVELLDEHGARVSDSPLTGPAVLPATGGERRARFLDADGETLATVPVSPWFAGDLGRYGSGLR